MSGEKSGLIAISLDSQLFWDLNVEYIQWKKGELTSKITDTRGHWT